jgi:hypothetical protein
MSDEDVVYWDTPEGVALFESVEVKPHFWTLCRYFDSEKFLTYCGIASGVTALNSLDIPSPDAPQIFPYKFFTQDNLFTDDVLHIRPPHDVEKNGNTLDQLASMLAVFEVDVAVQHADEVTAAACRTLLVDALRAPDKRVIVDFRRSVLGQKGSGHFSPLAAHHVGEDRFLLLDVARYKLPPCWVKAEVLYKAMADVDSVSGQARGFMILTRRAASQSARA